MIAAILVACFRPFFLQAGMESQPRASKTEN